MLPTLPDLESLALGAGKILKSYFTRENIKFSYKGTIDLVTEADTATEKYLLRQIRRKFPGDRIFTEESGEIIGNNEQVWYIDPLDGTVNFSHHIPHFCVSIAFAFHQELILAAVYDPMHRELYSAEYGKGAKLNGKFIHPSTTTDLQKSLLVTGFPYDLDDSERNNLGNFAHLTKLSQGVRSFGSAALDGCHVAAGRLDGFWEFSLKPWDVAAASLIASEAGGTVTALDGCLLQPVTSILITTPGIHQNILEYLQKK